MNRKQFHKIVSVTLFSIAFCYCPNLFSQMKVGNNPASINSNSAFEIESGNKGLLLPRIALSATTRATPLNSFVKGMLVYNTATDNDITPGLYYCDGTKWIKTNSANSNSEDSWKLNGNAGITSNNFLGTTNNAALILKTNNTERLRITGNGWVGIGTTTPTAALQIKGQLVIDSVSTGNLTTDRILVANPANGRVKSVSASSFISGVQKRLEVVAVSGQTVFNTPATITDINKILLYRNGILISFTLNNSSSIVAELPCIRGDEIRIIQLL